MKIKFGNKDREFIDKVFEGSVWVGKSTLARAIRWLLLCGKWIILLSIALIFAIVGIIHGMSKIKKVEDEPLGI